MEELSRARQKPWAIIVVAMLLCGWPTGCLGQTQENGTCTVDTSCLAQLSLETIPPMSTFKNISEAVLRCVGYQGVALRPLRILFPDGTQDIVTDVLPVFKNSTGFDVTPVFVPLEQLQDHLLDKATGRAFYDGWVSDSRWVMDTAQQGMLEPLDDYIAGDHQLDWLDVHRFFRTSGSVYNRSVIGVPVAGKISTLYYRADVFTAAGLQPPNTWQELLQVSKALNGTDFNGDDTTDYALCWQIDQPCLEQDMLVGQLLASMTQTQGTSSGWLFDIDTMTPTVNSPAFMVALEMIQQYLPYTMPNPTCSYWVEAFADGKCAMIVRWDEQFKVMQQVNKHLVGKIGFAQVPGSTVVLDRASGQLVNCTRATCPHATLETTQDGSQVLVNRAPFSSMSGFSGHVNAYSPADYRKATYEFYSHISRFSFSMQEVVELTTMGPFRSRHLSTSNASLAVWTAAGYRAEDVASFLSNMQTTLDNPNIALDIRINSGQRFRSALKRAVGLIVDGTPPATAQAATATEFASITADVVTAIPMSTFVNRYYAALNNPKTYIAPPPPSSSPPPPLTPGTQQSSGDGKVDIKTTMAVVFGGIVPGVVCVVLLFVYLSRSGIFRATPGVGPDTTLLVTDIENSTLMWEDLEQDAMNAALELHHGLIRKLLHTRPHMGYESATEGDSFILSFHTPQAALAFAQALQAGLLLLDWPEELLASTMAQPVWAKWATVSTGGAGPQAPLDPTTLKKPQSSMLRSLLDPAGAPWLVRAGSFTPRGSGNGISSPQQGAQEETSSLQRKPTETDPGAITQSQEAVAFLRAQWTACEPPTDGQSTSSVRLVCRGLRVRVGLHSGVHDTQDVVLNKTTCRTQYSGRPLSIAKAVGDCGHGGMVLLSESCFERIPVHKLAQFGMIIQMGDVLFLKAMELPPMSVYQVVAQGMDARLPFLDPKLRSVQQLQIGALGAPVGQASVAFANLVGASTLLAWDREVAQRAIDLYQQRAVTLMQSTTLLDSNGYVVELAGGFCLAAFQSSASAILWALHLVSELLNADWEEELLQHGLCEEVLIGGLQVATTATAASSAAGHGQQHDVAQSTRTSNSRSNARSSKSVLLPSFQRVLFRGPRVKIGIDTGTVHAALNPSTGRMAYRGRVMNRAARIADKAGSGQVWCSEASWLQYESLPAGKQNVDCQPLGPFVLKGVSGRLNLVQCVLPVRMRPWHPESRRASGANIFLFEDRSSCPTRLNNDHRTELSVDSRAVSMRRSAIALDRQRSSSTAGAVDFASRSASTGNAEQSALAPQRHLCFVPAASTASSFGTEQPTHQLLGATSGCLKTAQGRVPTDEHAVVGPPDHMGAAGKVRFRSPSGNTWEPGVDDLPTNAQLAQFDAPSADSGAQLMVPSADFKARGGVLGGPVPAFLHAPRARSTVATGQSDDMPEVPGTGRRHSAVTPVPEARSGSSQQWLYHPHETFTARSCRSSGSRYYGAGITTTVPALPSRFSNAILNSFTLHKRYSKPESRSGFSLMNSGFSLMHSGGSAGPHVRVVLEGANADFRTSDAGGGDGANEEEEDGEFGTFNGIAVPDRGS